MTATVARPGARPAPGRHGWRGGELLTARVSLTGRVIVHQVIMTSQCDELGRVTLWPRTTIQTDLGQVNPDDGAGWAHAQILLRTAGYEPAEHWTTIDRMPAVRLRRIRTASSRTVRGGN